MKKTILIVLGIFAFFILIFNIFISDPTFATKQEQMDYAFQSKQYPLAEATCLDLITTDSTNLDLYYNHLRAHFSIPEYQRNGRETVVREDDSILRFYKSKALSADSTQRDIGFYGEGLYHSYRNDYPTALEYLSKVKNQTFKYLHNTIGFVLIKTHDLKSAESHLLKEIAHNGNLEGAYSNLIALYLATNQLDKLKALLDDGKRPYFSVQELSTYYFKTGSSLNYLATVMSIGITHIDAQSLVAALLIMLVWMIYLRKIDLFRPERWSVIALTFVLGIVFSYGTFVISDLMHHLVGFELNGGVVNDFFYCFLGIGLVEETMKLLPFLLIMTFTREVDEPIDYIIYPSVSALGFAFAENILYFHGNGMEIVHGRAMIAAVIHMLCSSIVGYGLYFGLSGRQMGTRTRLIVFLLIAALVHGVFDFWLINPVVSPLAVVSIIMAINGLFVWNSFINNALNFSMPEGQEMNTLDHLKIKNYLIYSLSGILLFEYVAVTLNYGPKTGNTSLINAAMSGAYLIAFVSSSLSTFKLQRNTKKAIRFSRDKDAAFDQIVDEPLSFSRLTTPSFDVLPCVGKVVERLTIEEESNWYLVLLDKTIENYTVCPSHVVIKIKNSGFTLERGKKTAIGFFLIKPDQLPAGHQFEKSDLLFVGWANAI